MHLLASYSTDGSTQTGAGSLVSSASFGSYLPDWLSEPTDCIFALIRTAVGKGFLLGAHTFILVDPHSLVVGLLILNPSYAWLGVVPHLKLGAFIHPGVASLSKSIRFNTFGINTWFYFPLFLPAALPIVSGTMKRGTISEKRSTFKLP